MVPQFEKASGHKVAITWAGTNDIKKRIAAGEVYDLDRHRARRRWMTFIKDGKVVAGTKVDLVRSGIGVGVKAGAPKPDFSSADALKKTLIAAKTVGYSSGPSGVYMAEPVREDGHRRSDQGQGQGGAARRSGRNRRPQRRSRDRLPAGQRIDPRKGHRLSRPAARGHPADHHVLGRHPHRRRRNRKRRRRCSRSSPRRPACRTSRSTACSRAEHRPDARG